jgi:hypothetical protein
VGSVCDLSFGEERRRRGGVGDGRRWGFIWGARAVGLYRSFLRDGEGNFVIACKVFAGRVALGPRLSGGASSGGGG